MRRINADILKVEVISATPQRRAGWNNGIWRD